MSANQQGHPDPDAERRRRVEELLHERGADQEDLVPEDTRTLIHELQVHQIELEMQNEELRTAQFQIEAMRDQYANLYDFAPVGYLTLETNGLISQANFTSAAMLSRERGQLIEQRFTKFVLEADQDNYYRHFRRVVAASTPQVYEVRLVRKDGAYFYALLDETPIVNHEGRVCQCRVAISDITAQKQADAVRQENDILRAALEKEKEMAALRSQLMLTIAHEFRTPLAIILTASVILEEYKDYLSGATRSEKLNNIREQVEHLTDLLDSLTFVVKARQAHLDQKSGWVDPVQLCTGIVAELQGMTRPGHRLVFSNSEPVERAYLDPNLLRRVLVNLVSNAIKYSPDGGTIELCLTGDAEKLVFEVKDEGIGIPQEASQRLFEPFFRASNVDAISGMGIGLTMVQEAVNQLGGSIEWTSGLGSGTTFVVIIPVRNNDGRIPQPKEDPSKPSQ
jgi:two-component system sensor kinase FixL